MAFDAGCTPQLQTCCTSAIALRMSAPAIAIPDVTLQAARAQGRDVYRVRGVDRSTMKAEYTDAILHRRCLQLSLTERQPIMVLMTQLDKRGGFLHTVHFTSIAPNTLGLMEGRSARESPREAY